MIPAVVPDELKDLTQCEEMLIAKAFPVMLVYTKPGCGYLGYKGHVITLPHDVQHIATVLPNLPNELPIVKLECKNSNEKSRDFVVRRDKVLCALKWLISNNPFYKDVTIDIQRINTLPVNGNIEDRVLKVNTLSEDGKVDLGPSNDDEKERTS